MNLSFDRLYLYSRYRSTSKYNRHSFVVTFYRAAQEVRKRRHGWSMTSYSCRNDVQNDKCHWTSKLSGPGSRERCRERYELTMERWKPWWSRAIIRHPSLCDVFPLANGHRFLEKNVPQSGMKDYGGKIWEILHELSRFVAFSCRFRRCSDHRIARHGLWTLLQLSDRMELSSDRTRAPRDFLDY